MQRDTTRRTTSCIAPYFLRWQLNRLSIKWLSWQAEYLQTRRQTDRQTRVIPDRREEATKQRLHLYRTAESLQHSKSHRQHKPTRRHAGKLSKMTLWLLQVLFTSEVRLKTGKMRHGPGFLTASYLPPPDSPGIYVINIKYDTGCCLACLTIMLVLAAQTPTVKTDGV